METSSVNSQPVENRFSKKTLLNMHIVCNVNNNSNNNRNIFYIWEKCTQLDRYK